ncbi:hypothetical protein MJO29_002971 [Puccinia striiformis f. sp. tritici]|nr:hypothetical protein MJO29_002971 [Puccinia striiformis f. sp. tritici]
MEDIELIGSQEVLEPTSSALTSQPSQDTSTAISTWSLLPKPPQILNVGMLKQAITYFIAEADLPYTIVERKSFIYLLELLNPSTANMEYGRKNMANEIDLVLYAHKNELRQTLKGIKPLAFTLDVWTSPNQKAFMTITMHGITAGWKMSDLVIGMPNVIGQDFGHNFGNIFVDLIQEMKILDLLVSITADNASNNSTLARQVKRLLGRSIFSANTQLLGCMAHVINLAAHDGITAFGASPPSEGTAEEEIMLNRMDSIPQVDRVDSLGVNLQTIVHHILGLATYVCNSTQHREGFEFALNLVNRQGEHKVGLCHNGKMKMLILDVRPRWNLTYKMLKRALELKLVCIAYCNGQAETEKYSLMDNEWDKVNQITKFLEPLYIVTKMLCGSRYPSLGMALPIYISILKSIYSIRLTYDASQLIPAADLMIDKLKKYLISAFQKTTPICTMLLNP